MSYFFNFVAAIALMLGTQTLAAARNHFPPGPGPCADFLCQRLGVFACDESSEAIRLLEACRGNYGAGCVQAVCNKMSLFGCDELGEAVQVAAACRGNYDGQCVDMMCNRLGIFGCDELSEVTAIARQCSYWTGRRAWFGVTPELRGP